MTQRERLKRAVKSLPAEGAISGMAAALPGHARVRHGGLNPEYMSELFDETIGKIALYRQWLMMIGDSCGCSHRKIDV